MGFYGVDNEWLRALLWISLAIGTAVLYGGIIYALIWIVLKSYYKLKEKLSPK